MHCTAAMLACEDKGGLSDFSMVDLRILCFVCYILHCAVFDLIFPCGWFLTLWVFVLTVVAKPDKPESRKKRKRKAEEAESVLPDIDLSK